VIADEGTGFKKEDLDKVFDPFFSTKENSYGLGMPLVSHIIKEHLGEIEVESEEGKGTVFKLSFPIRWIQ
jgi:signal transduction histidine kinase